MAKKTCLKFAANISMLWREEPKLALRYSLARAAGFKFVECTFPYMEDVEELARERENAGVEQVLVNSFPGNIQGGELGLAALPGRTEDFKESIELSAKYAKALGCKYMHVMAGKKVEGCDVGQMEDTYVENLRYCAERLKKDGVMALIEPLNPTYTAPNYFLDSFHQAVEIIKKVDHPNLRLQLDIYHLQCIHGNLTRNIEDFLPYAGHIQVAQPPLRSQLDDPGEINYAFILDLLDKHKWFGYIGLEYSPQGSTEESLKWIQNWIAQH